MDHFGARSRGILGYSVQAATTDFAGRSYTAWFTTDIPIPDGPHVFSWFTRFDSRCFDTDKHFRFQLEGVEKPEEETIWKIPEYKSIENVKEYNRLTPTTERLRLIL